MIGARKYTYRKCSQHNTEFNGDETTYNHRNSLTRRERDRDIYIKIRMHKGI